MTDAMTPSDPLFADRVRDSFDRQPAMALIGARLLRIEPGLVEIGCDFRRELTQQHGFFHGGITAMIADSAGGYAAYTLFEATSSVLTVEFKINLIAPAAGDRLLARGRVVKPGRTLTVTELSVSACKDGEWTECARGLQTLIQLANRSDRG
jgi:uncharacterized protein (TIGR00369 family)